VSVTARTEAAGSRSIFEADAFAALQRAAGSSGATSHALAEASTALELAGLAALARQTAKVLELHRLATARLAGVLRALGEGSAE
jgi:hypothetical protein